MYVDYRKPNGESGVQLNERFRYTRTVRGPGIIKLSREEYVVTDIGTNEVLARQIDFRKATLGPGLAGSGWKFWLSSYDGCFKDYPQNFPNGGINRYMDNLRTDCSPTYMTVKPSEGIVVECHRRN